MITVLSEPPISSTRLIKLTACLKGLEMWEGVEKGVCGLKCQILTNTEKKHGLLKVTGMDS